MARADVMAGRAYVSLYTKGDALTRGLQKARTDLNKFASDMVSMGARMVAMTAAIATPVAFAVKKFSDFDDAMRAVGAVSQATEAQLQSMTDVAKNLGATTSFTAVQVAQLMTELGRAGFQPDQVNAMTAAVMNLARATGTDATLASGIMAATIRQFALEATDAARVADVLTKAANSTFNTVEGLGESLGYAGPVAKELGLSLEDTVAILGTLGNVGIQGSEAGTALRRLGVISAATGEKLKGIFNISNVDAAGNLKPLVQILGEIGDVTENLPVAEKVAKMNEAFGLLGITSASVLSRTAGDTRKLANELRNAEGAASDAATSMDAGLGGAFRIVMSAAEGLQIALGKALSGSIKGITESITGLLSSATEWVAKNQELVTTFASVALSVGAVGVAFIAVGLSAKIAAVGVGVAITAIGIAKTVMLAFAAGAQIMSSAAIATGTAMYIYTSAVAVANSATALATAAAGALSAAWVTAGAVISGVWAVITAPITPFIVAAGIVVSVVAGIAAAAAYATVKGADFSAAWATVTGTLSEMLSIAKTVGGILMEAFAGGDYDIAFRAAMAGIKLALANLIDGMISLWSQFWAGAWNMTKAFFTNFAAISWKIVKAIANAIANPFQAAAAIKTALSDLVNGKHEIKLGLDTGAMRDTAKKEIENLEKELEARKAKREAEQAQKQSDIEKAAQAGVPGAVGDGAPVGNATAAGIDAEAEEQAIATASAFDRETEALQQQIIALQQGADAAERFRLAKEGLTEAEINQVMALRKQQEQLQKHQERAGRIVGRIQDFADADFEKNKVSSAEVAKREKEAIARAQKAGVLDSETAKQAMAEADIRKAERDHQEKLKKFRGDEEKKKSTFGDIGLKEGGASAATFSARSLLSMGSGAGQGPQVRALMQAKKAIESQTKLQKEQSDAQIAAIKQSKMKHA
jgi:TP901 family phage tail tape measure protein